MRMQVTTLFRLQSLPRMRNLKILGRLLMSNAAPQVMVLPNIQVAAILITRSPEADPEVDLKVGHLVGPATPLLLATGFILATEFVLVTESMMETEVETRTTDLIMDLTILTILTMTGTMMTGSMTLTAGIMAGVTTGDLMAVVHTGLFPVGPHLLQGLMTVTQLTWGTCILGVTLVSEIDETIVVPLIANIMLTIVMAIDVRVLTMITGTVTGRDKANLPQSQSAARVIPENTRSETEEFHVVYLQQSVFHLICC